MASRQKRCRAQQGNEPRYLADWLTGRLQDGVLKAEA
jgi:hypothetical protein